MALRLITGAVRSTGRSLKELDKVQYMGLRLITGAVRSTGRSLKELDKVQYMGLRLITGAVRSTYYTAALQIETEQMPLGQYTRT